MTFVLKMPTSLSIKTVKVQHHVCESYFFAVFTTWILQAWCVMLVSWFIKHV